MKFTEFKLEHAFAELLAQEGYPHCLGNTLTRQPDEVYTEIFEQAENLKRIKIDDSNQTIKER